MPVNKDLLDDIPEVDHSAAPAKKKVASTPVADSGSLLDDIPDVVPRGTNTEPPPPVNTAKAPMQSIVNNTDHQQDALSLGLSTDYLAKVLGSDFGQASKRDMKDVTTENHTYVLSSVPGVDISPVEHKPEAKAAQQAIKKEADASPQYIIDDINHSFNFLPEQVRLHVDKDHLAQTLASPTGGIPELQAYYQAKVMALKAKYDPDKFTQMRQQRFPMGHEFTADDQRMGEAEEADFKKKAADEFNTLHRAVFNVASMKVVNDHLAKNEPIDPGKIGEQVRTIMGDGAQVDAYKQVVPVTPAKPTGQPGEAPIQYTDINQRATVAIPKIPQPGIPSQAQLESDKIGFQALDYATKKAFADGDLPKAKELYDISKDANQKILERYPGYKKQQVAKAIENYAYQQANPWYTSVQGYAVDKSYIQRAAKKIGIPASDVESITPADIKTVPDIFTKIVSGLVNGVTGLKVAEQPDAAGSVQPTVVDTNPNSATYLQDVPAANTGNINWTAGAISNQIGEGLGQFVGFVGEAGALAKGLEGANIINNAATAERIANAATIIGTSYGDNYRQGQELFGDNEGKKHLYAMVNSLLMAGTNEILPKTKVAKDILGINTMAGREFIQKVEKDGIESLTEPQLKNYIVSGLKEFTKTQGVMLGISELNTVGNNISRMVLAPESNTGLLDNTTQSAASSVLSMMLPAIASGATHQRNQSMMHKQMLYEVGSDPNKYISEINAQVAAGSMSPDQAKSSAELVNRMSDIVSKSVPVESPVNNQQLTRNQRIEYANNLLQEQLLSEKKSSIKDKVQTKPIDDQIKTLEAQREEVLANAGEPVHIGSNAIPPEEIPQHNFSPQKKENDGTDQEIVGEQLGSEAEHTPSQEPNVPIGEEQNGQEGHGQEVLLTPAPEAINEGAGQPASSLGFEEEPSIGFEEEKPEEPQPDVKAEPQHKEVSLGGKLKMAIPEDQMDKVVLVNARDLAETSHQTDRNEASQHKVSTMEAEGIKEPLRVSHDPEDGTYELANGNHRLDEAIRLGAEKVPVVVHDIVGKLGPTAKKIEVFPVESVEPKVEDNSPEALRTRNLSPEEDTRLTELEGMNSYDQYKHAQELAVLRHKAYKSPEEVPHTANASHINVADAVRDGKYQKWVEEGRMSPEDAKAIIEGANVPVPQDILDRVNKVDVPEPEAKVKAPIARPEPVDQDKPVNTEFLTRTPADEKLSEGVGANIKDKFDNATKIVGFDGHSTLPNGKEVSGHYVLIDANAITPSHNPFSFGSSEGYPMMENGHNPNDRDYTLKKNIDAVVDHATNYNGLAVKNTPTVDKNGVVIDGNDRTMSGQKAAKDRTDGDYIDNLKKNAKMFGFTAEDVDSMIDRSLHPRLIFVPDEVHPYTTKTFAKFNKETQKPKNAFEVAIEHHRNLSDDIVDRMGNILDRHDDMTEFFSSSADQKQMHALLTKEGVLNPTNSAQFYDSETLSFTDDGKKLVQNILLAKTLDEESLRIIQQHPAVAEKIVKSIKNIVGIDASAKYGLAKTINDAVKLYHAVDEYATKANLPKKDKQKALELYLRQNNLFGDNPEETQSTINMFTAISSMGSRAFREFTGEMYEYAKRNNHAMGVDLFGEEKAPKSQLLKQAHDAIAEFERSKADAGKYAKSNDVAQHGPGDAKAADRNIPKAREAVPGNEPEVGKDEPAKPDKATAEAVPEDVVKPAPEVNAKISNPEKQTIDQRLTEKTDEVNDLQHKINLSEASLSRLRDNNDTDGDAYKIKLKVWQQLNGKLDRAQKEYDALIRKRMADATADKIRSKKIKGGNDGMVFGAGPAGVIAKLAHTVGKEIINGSLEVAALAVQAGYHIKTAIDRAVDYINRHYKGDPWDEASFREALGEKDLYTDEMSPADKAAGLRKMMAGEQKLTKKNESLADALIKKINDKESTLEETLQKINDEKISDQTKKAITHYISKAINGDRNRFVYDEKAQQVFKDMVRQKVVDGKEYNEIVDELEANPLLRGQKLNFQERESIQEELGRHKLIQEVLNDKSILKDKTAVRSVMNRIADSAFVHDDAQLTEVLNNVDSRYQIQSHKDVMDYVDDVVKTFGPEQSERIAMNQGLNPARRQLLLARIADEYKSADNQRGLENMLTRIAYNATQYGQGIEATKLVYKLLGMTGGKGANAYIHALIDGIQSKFLAAHKNEVDQLKKQIGDLKAHVSQLMKSNGKVADSIKRALKKAKETGLKAQKAAIDQRQKLSAVLDKNLKVAKGKLITPQDIFNMRTRLAEDIKEALPMVPQHDLEEYTERIGDLFNQHVKDINEGHLASFYNDVMFPGDKPAVDRNTRVAEDIMNVVNAGNLANNKIDQLTLDAIRQKYGIDVNAREFTKGVNELVDRANAHPEGLTAGTATRLKDDIAKFIMLHNTKDTTNYALKATGHTIRDLYEMTPKERMLARKEISGVVMKEIESLQLNNSDPVANRWDIGNKVYDNIDRLLTAEKDRRNISKPEHAEQDLLNFYNNTMFPDKSRYDTRDMQMAEELVKVVNAADNVNGGHIDQHTLDAMQQKYGLTFVSDGFSKALMELVDRVNQDPKSRERGVDTFLKDDVAKLVRLYTVPDSIEHSGTALGIKVDELATKLQSVQDGSLKDITDNLVNEYGKLGLTVDDAAALSQSIGDEYGKLLKSEANKFLSADLVPKDKSARKNDGTFYDHVVKEVSALRLGDDRFQQLFAEKHGLKPFTPADFDTLRDHAEKAKFLKPGTSEYGQQVEKFFAHIQAKDPEYMSNLFKGLRASKLLFSVGFTMKTAFSNVAKIYTRGLIEYARSAFHGVPDANILRLTFPNIQRLFGGEAFDKYATNYVKYVLDGGIPVSNTYEQEFAEHAGKINSRLEEYPLQDDNGYTKLAKLVMRVGSRLQNSVDSYGQVRSSEIVQYARMLQGTAEELKQVNPNVTPDEIRAETQRRFALTDKAVAYQKAHAEFAKLGEDLPLDSPRFQNRAMEIQREHRDEQAFNFARNLSRLDFWKESEHGLMGGVGGLMETTLSKFRDILRKPLETHPKAELVYDGAMFQVFGFLGGASRFYEDSLEHVLPYSLIKAGLLQLGKTANLTPEERELIDRKQFDIIMKGAGTLLMSAGAISAYNFMKAMIASNEDKDKNKWGWYGSGKAYSLPESQLYKGLPKDGFLINGHKLPFDFVVPQQMDVPTRIYANMEDYARTADEKGALMRFLFSGWHALPHSPWPGLLENINDVRSSYGTDDFAKQQQKLQDVGYQKIGEFVTAYVPIPQRIIAESYQLFDQRQLSKIEPTLPIAQGDGGLEAAAKMLINFGARSIFSTSQALGINNIISTAGVLNKPAVDYRGREINTGMQYSNSFTSVPNVLHSNQADPLPHDDIDALLVKNHAELAYYSRYGNAQMMFKGAKHDDDYTEIGPDGTPVQKYANEIRYMTDKEFYNFQYSMGKLTDEALKENYDNWVDATPADVKSSLRSIQKSIFEYSKKGIESGMDADQIIAGYKNGAQIDLPFPNK